MSDVYTFSQGTGPLLVSMPHVGLNVPADIGALLTEQAQALPYTDWYVDKLYDFLPDLGVSTLRANYSRYVVDLNRAPDNSSLYPGQSVTEICPTTLFTCEPLYKPNCEPSAEQVRQRVEQYWLPYHQKISAELQRIKRQFGYALLWDAHSIKNQVPVFSRAHFPTLIGVMPMAQPARRPLPRACNSRSKLTESIQALSTDASKAAISHVITARRPTIFMPCSLSYHKIPTCQPTIVTATSEPRR